MKKLEFLLQSISGHLPDTCIEWPYGIIGGRGGGYGQVYSEQRPFRVHVVSYATYHGLALPLPDGLIIRHDCDNRRCFNPKHLQSGSPKDNIHDAISRGRINLRGAARTQAKLTEENVRFIRGNSGLTGASLALKFGVARSLISRILKGQAWTHILGVVEEEIAA